MDEGKEKEFHQTHAQKHEPYFHSVNVKNTKASEEKEYFTNIKKESKAKELTKELISKTKSKLDIKNKIKEIQKDRIIKISIITIISVFGLLLGKEAFQLLTTDEITATKVLEETPWKGILYYDYLIQKANTNEDKAALHTIRAETLYEINPTKYKNQIENDQKKAEELNSAEGTEDTGEDKG